MNKNFQFDWSEEELKDAFKDHIKRNYREWMNAIQNYAARYANSPSAENMDSDG